MPYDPARDPWRASAVSKTGLGRAGAPVTPHDTDDLARYARIRVFAPARPSPVLETALARHGSRAGS